MSARHSVAEQIAAFVRDNDLAQIHGGEAIRASHRRWYEIGLSRLRTLEGVVQVYSLRFIMINLKGSLAPEREWRGVYGNSDDALKVLQLALIDRNRAAALAVPQVEGNFKR